MANPTVAVASLGGTITMTSASGRSVQPELTGEQLIAAVPALAEFADVQAATLETLPGASLTFKDVLRALHWARAQVVAGAVGAVIVQGTDTIEESSYLLDLYWDVPEPLVVVGAMRSPQTPGADGPANLIASVRVAADSTSRDRGVLVVLNDQIHAARRVRKTWASGPGAFESRSFGPLGYVDELRPVYGCGTVPQHVLPMPGLFSTPRVGLIETYFDDDGTLLNALVHNGFKGAVVAGFGVGHVAGGFADAIAIAVASMPIVFASRTGAGSTHRDSYRFRGSESDLLDRGAIPAGWLDARKARVLLTCLLAGGADIDAIRNEFIRRGSAL
jgi:L-asparaginase